MDEWIVRNIYQEKLAERSLVVEAAADGEYWTFHWYMNPLSNGLSRWHRISAHIYSNGDIALHGMWMPKDEEEIFEFEQAMKFIKNRYKEVGFDETLGAPDQENRD
jgi:hypothetical protein